MAGPPTAAPPFADRAAGGAEIARLAAAAGFTNTLLAAIPMGGVEVAAPATPILGAQLEVVGARPVGMVADVTLAVGGVAEDGSAVFDPEFDPGFAMLAMVEAATELARTEARRTAELLRGDRPLKDMTGKQVILMEDVVLSCWPALAAADFVRRRGAYRVAIAAPIGVGPALQRLERRGLEVLCPVRLDAIPDLGACYADAAPPNPERAAVALVATTGW